MDVAFSRKREKGCYRYAVALGCSGPARSTETNCETPRSAF